MPTRKKSMLNTRAQNTANAAGGPDVGNSEDLIYERILAAIFEHRLPPGTKLGEDRLASIFGVSRARIRRVLPRLAHEGVVTLEPNRGAFVTEPTVEEARDVFEARRLIEPAILRRLMRRGDLAEMLSKLREHVGTEACARAAGDSRAIVRLSGEFHTLLADMAGNVLLAKAMRELASLTCLIIALYDRPSVPACLGEEHAEIVDVVASGDCARASELMVQHLDHVESNLELDQEESLAVDLEAVLR